MSLAAGSGSSVPPAVGPSRHRLQIPTPARARPERHRDTIKILLDAVPPALVLDGAARDRLITRSREMLRRLCARAPRVPFVKNDSMEARAAVVLEHVLRRGELGVGSAVVPLEKLGKRIGMKKRAIVQLQTSLGHYLEDIDDSGRGVGDVARTTRRSTGSSRRQSAGAAASGTLNDDSCVSVSQCDTIRDLSIRFGSIVANSDGCARRAEGMLADLVKHMWGKMKSDRSFYLADVRKNRTAYEAACFHLVVQSDMNEVGRQRGLLTEPAAEDDEEETEGRLTDALVMAACKLSDSTFKKIMRTVSELAKEMESNAGGKIGMKRKNSGRQGIDSISDHKLRVSKVESREDGAHEKLLSGTGLSDCNQSCKELTKDQMTPKRSDFEPSPAFRSWSDSVLCDAREKAKCTLQEEKGTLLEMITDEEALEGAAMDMLRRHGLSLPL